MATSKRRESRLRRSYESGKRTNFDSVNGREIRLEKNGPNLYQLSPTRFGKVSRNGSKRTFFTLNAHIVRRAFWKNRNRMPNISDLSEKLWWSRRRLRPQMKTELRSSIPAI